MPGIDGYRVRAHRESRNTTGPIDTTAATGGLNAGPPSAFERGRGGYPSRMRRIIILAALLVGLCACGSSAASTTPHRIVFGISGGNMVPSQVTIEPTGRIHASGPLKPTRRQLSHAKVVSLSRLVREDFAAGLKSRLCPGTNPDVGSHFIQAYGRTVRVHGGCEPRFSRLWDTLAKAVGLRSG